MRKTKEQLIEERREKNISQLVIVNKFFANPTHHKNNYWSWAAWDSWAAKGYAGGCSYCANKHYNATLKNKRAKTERFGRNQRYPVYVSGNLCSECVKLIETKLCVSFTKF